MRWITSTKWVNIYFKQTLFFILSIENYIYRPFSICNICHPSFSTTLEFSDFWNFSFFLFLEMSFPNGKFNVALLDCVYIFNGWSVGFNRTDSALVCWVVWLWQGCAGLANENDSGWNVYIFSYKKFTMARRLRA